MHFTAKKVVKLHFPVKIYLTVSVRHLPVEIYWIFCLFFTWLAVFTHCLEESVKKWWMMSRSIFRGLSKMWFLDCGQLIRCLEILNYTWIFELNMKIFKRNIIFVFTFILILQALTIFLLSSPYNFSLYKESNRIDSFKTFFMIGTGIDNSFTFSILESNQSKLYELLLRSVELWFNYSWLYVLNYHKILFKQTK